MSKSKPSKTQKTQNVQADAFQSIDPNELNNVSGGAARVTARSKGADAQVTAMLTQIGDSIKSLASQPKDDGMSQMMMMMMMMGGMGGGAPAPAPQPQQPLPPVINVTNSHRGGCH